jgi:hypothetical protein
MLLACASLHLLSIAEDLREAERRNRRLMRLYLGSGSPEVEIIGVALPAIEQSRVMA